MALRLVSLGSGSHGNATLLEHDGCRILVDAGLAARTLEQRLRAVGVEARSIDAIVLSHEHQDHSRGTERFSRKHGVPVWCPLETLEAMNLSPIHLADWQPLGAGRAVEVARGVSVDPFMVPHDAACPLGFVIEASGVRVGIATDLGQATTLVVQRLKGCHLIMVESNHDDALLQRGRYPWHLKQRVGGRLGHLSNEEAAALVRRTVGPECRAVMLAHLSENNNTPELAREATWRVLERSGAAGIPLHIAPRRSPSVRVEL